MRGSPRLAERSIVGVMTGVTTAPNPHGSEATTHGVRVRAEPRYLKERSDPSVGKFLFGYRITIFNESDHPIRVEGRRWRIVDADGTAHEVEGLGIVGRQPEIPPGEQFEYSSYAPLATPWGTMEGGYRVIPEDGEAFEAKVDRFYLVSGGG
jgi:ApaG protein